MADCEMGCAQSGTQALKAACVSIERIRWTAARQIHWGDKGRKDQPAEDGESPRYGVPLISVQKVTVPIRPESEHLRGSGSLAQGKSLSGNDFLLVPHSACEALFVGLISCGGACFAGRL